MRIVIALAGGAGLVLQLVVAPRTGLRDSVPAWHSVLIALSYFTVLTNRWVTMLVSARVASVRAASCRGPERSPPAGSGSVVGNIASSGVGSLVVMLIVGSIKSKMAGARQ